MHPMCEGLKRSPVTRTIMSRAIPFAFIKQKFQELISAYPKYQDYLVMALLRYHTTLDCVNLDNE